MALGLNGNSGIVTYGSRGIGLAIAKTLARKGASVSIGACNTAQLEEATSMTTLMTTPMTIKAFAEGVQRVSSRSLP